MDNHIEKIKKLVTKGVRVPNPQSVEIGDEVDLDRIAGDGVIIYSGCKLFGKSTLILKGVSLGYEGPVTIENCQVGPFVKLQGGFFKDAAFLKKSSMGLGAHVREGTILEEEASGAHAVGLKQTILFPFVTLGSLINFCDCLMSGGTSRKNHSEVGSSYIHFNYTVNQDKATPSLMGNVPDGVMLNQKSIFLGGQGGLVGPTVLTFGTVSAAGTIIRKDELRQGRLIIGGAVSGGNIPYSFAEYNNVKRVVLNNITYLANLIALKLWYHNIRVLFISSDFPEPLFEGVKLKLDMAIRERLKRLKEYSKKAADYAVDFQKRVKTKDPSLFLQQILELNSQWPDMEKTFIELCHDNGNIPLRDRFIENLLPHIHRMGKDYIHVIKTLRIEHSREGALWLQEIVDSVIDKTLRLIPSFS